MDGTDEHKNKDDKDYEESQTENDGEKTKKHIHDTYLAFFTNDTLFCLKEQVFL